MWRRSILLCLSFMLILPVFGNILSEGDSLIFAPKTNYFLEKPQDSGDKQSEKVKTKLEKPIRVKVLDEYNVPVANVPVQFQNITQVKEAASLTIITKNVLSDSSGIAETEIILGSDACDYQIAARIESSMDRNLLIYSFQARRTNWFFMLVIGLLGGLGLFLMGMDMMSEGLKKSAGDKLRSILGSLTKNRVLAVLLGTFVTMIVQSSSATSVMLVGFVNSKLMKFKRTIGIIIGANIGTTVTAQLIAFNISEYSLLMIALGFAFFYFSKKQGYKYMGQSILGFGILFFGMQIMSDAMHPLRSFAPFIDLLQVLENPLLGIIVGVGFTALIQSSAAFIGIVIVLASQGLITLEAAIPLLLGSNIGTAITAFLASINSSREAKKVALANALINVFGMLLLVLWIPAYANIVVNISPKSSLPSTDVLALADTIPRQIANAHSLFNVMLAIILLPFTNLVAKLVDLILPEIVEKEDLFMQTLYLDSNLISTPALGLNLAKQETLRIGTITQDMLSDCILPFVTKQPHILKDLVNKEKQIDFLAEEISSYLTKIIRESVGSNRTDEAFQIMYTVKELEEIADIIGNLLVTRAETWIGDKVEFSDQGKKELLEYHILTQKQLSRALEVFKDVNLEKAKKMKAKHSEYRVIASELEKQHYLRLREAKQIESVGDSHMELMTKLRTITHHSTNIARIMLDWKSVK